MVRCDEIVVVIKIFFLWCNLFNIGFFFCKVIFQFIDDSLMCLGMDYVDFFQIYCFDYFMFVEEIMEVLYDVVKVGKVCYIGVFFMEVWCFVKMQYIVECNGWI